MCAAAFFCNINSEFGKMFLAAFFRARMSRRKFCVPLLTNALQLPDIYLYISQIFIHYASLICIYIIQYTSQKFIGEIYFNYQSGFIEGLFGVIQSFI